MAHRRHLGVTAGAGLLLWTAAAGATTAGAFALAAFVIDHVYLPTTGHTVFGVLKAMVTGWEVVEEHPTAPASGEPATGR